MASNFKTPSCEVSGLDELNKRLDKLQLFVEKDVLKKAMRTSMGIIVEAARELAPVKTGRVQRAIRVRMGRSSTGISVLASIGRKYFQGPEFYGAFQEFGFQTGKRGSAKRKRIRGEHFMQYAFEEKKQEALDTFIAEVKAGLQREGQ